VRLLRSLWFLYGITVFFVLFILCFPFYVVVFIIFRKKAVRPLIRFSHHVVARLSLFSMLIRTKNYHFKNIDSQKVYVFISNHQAAIDILLSASITPFPFKFLSKKEVEKSHFSVISPANFL